jgi:hypothetical protein
MMRDVYMLSRYNNWVKEMKDTDKQGALDAPTRTKLETAEGQKITSLMIQSAQAPPLVQYKSVQRVGPAGAPLRALSSATTTHRNIWNINLPGSTEESIANTGIQNNVMSQMSTQRKQNKGEIEPIQQAENSRAADFHDEIHPP